MKSWLETNFIEIYSTCNDGKSVVAERFIRKLKNKFYKYFEIAKNVYIDKSVDIVDKYNNTCHSTIEMKPVDVKPTTCIKCSKEINYQDLKFKIGEIVRISKYKNIFAKRYVPNGPEAVFVIENLKTLFHELMFLVILKEKKLQKSKSKKV